MNIVLRQMAEHISVPLSLEVRFEVSTAFPFFVHDDAAGVVEVSSPQVVNAAFFGVGAF